MEPSARCLYLIPSTLGDSPIENVLPAYNLGILRTLDHFVVEEEKTARRFLIRCGYPKPIQEIQFFLLNEHTSPQSIPEIFKSSKGNLGLLSEAGVPAVADPGSSLVEEAHRQHIRVIPLCGPSSLMLAMMASGLNGQNFAFNGYLPVKNPERINRIKQLEKRSELEKQSQLFIEAPYRNNQMISVLLETCKQQTRLCIAANLTLANEWIMTKSVRDWRSDPPPDLQRQPAIFIIQG